MVFNNVLMVLKVVFCFNYLLVARCFLSLKLNQITRIMISLKVCWICNKTKLIRSFIKVNCFFTHWALSLPNYWIWNSFWKNPPPLNTLIIISVVLSVYINYNAFRIIAIKTKGKSKMLLFKKAVFYQIKRPKHDYIFCF